MKRLLFTIILFVSLTSAVFPSVAAAQNNLNSDGSPKLDYSGIVNCDGVVRDGVFIKGPSEPDRQRECNLVAAFDLVTKLINWGFYLSIPLATALFAYAGFLYITGSKGNIGTAKKIFTSVAIGFIIVTTAWVGVRTFLDWFVKPNTGATTFIQTK